MRSGHMAIVIALVLLLASLGGVMPSSEPVQSSTIEYSSREEVPVFAPGLEEKLRAGDGELEVIIQTWDRLDHDDEEMIRAQGLEVLSTYHALPSAWARGSHEEILLLSTNDRIKHIEENFELDLFMDRTTSTINATATWNSFVVNRHGVLEYESSGDWSSDASPYSIDGTGVTAAVLDTGIDAGHPDLDYGEKTIISLKSTGTDWVENENSDTSSGHGTHCSGTVAGNGDASAGSRRGVAPGAKLVGLSAGDIVFVNFAVQGLTWVYEHTRPGSNIHNIRVVSNSWGAGGAEYDPDGAITILTEMLTFDNNVAVVFAAGNSGGDGSDIQTNPYANTPSAINVAALSHNGEDMAGFSSRGDASNKETWPDIGAPGVDIWATAPRGTVIDFAQRPTDDDLYYMAISGTSMATPHISGVVALLFQAAPSMQTSEVRDDSNGNTPDWGQKNTTRIHEVELILELTADRITGDGVPDAPSTSNETSRLHDFAQGYGRVDVDEAVALALTLEEMRTRDLDQDGDPDLGAVTVWDALDHYHSLRDEVTLTADTDMLRTHWRGDWTHANGQAGNNVATYNTNDTHLAYVPPEGSHMSIDFQFNRISSEAFFVTEVQLWADADGDGVNDLTPVPTVEGNKHYELDITEEMTDREWEFHVVGQAIGMAPNEFLEPLVEYEVQLNLQVVGESHLHYETPFAHQSRWIPGSPSPSYGGAGFVMLHERGYDISLLELVPPTESEEEASRLLFYMVVAGGSLMGLVLLVGLAFLLGRSRGSSRASVPAAAEEPADAAVVGIED